MPVMPIDGSRSICISSLLRYDLLRSIHHKFILPAYAAMQNRSRIENEDLGSGTIIRYTIVVQIHIRSIPNATTTSHNHPIVLVLYQ